jgi:hypothetical protein
MLVAGAAPPSLELVGSKEAHVSADARDAERCMGRFHHLALAGGYEHCRTENGTG